MSVNQGNIKKAIFIISAIISSWAFSAARTHSLSAYKIQNFNGLGKIYVSEDTKISSFIDVHFYISEKTTPYLENTVYVSRGTKIIRTIYGNSIYIKNKQTLIAHFQKKLSKRKIEQEKAEQKTGKKLTVILSQNTENRHSFSVSFLSKFIILNPTNKFSQKYKDRLSEYLPNFFFETKSHRRFAQMQYYFTPFNKDNTLRGPPSKRVIS